VEADMYRLAIRVYGLACDFHYLAGVLVRFLKGALIELLHRHGVELRVALVRRIGSVELRGEGAAYVIRYRKLPVGHVVHGIFVVVGEIGLDEMPGPGDAMRAFRPGGLA